MLGGSSWLLFLATGALAEQFVPDTIYLPYSDTEDADFTIERPGRSGCYQWSCEDDEVIELVPIHTNYDLQCGSRLELKILPGTADPNGPVTLTIVAENVDTENIDEATAVVVFTVVVVPVARLEVLGVKTELQAGEPPSPFGVAAYDKDGNELDSLDGVTLQWFIGSAREVAKFRDTAVGPIINLVAERYGKGQVICMIADPHYASLQPGVLEFSIKAPLRLEPDGVYLLPGGEAPIRLFEELGTKDAPRIEELPLAGDLAVHQVASREEGVARVDMERRVVIAGVEEDETSLLVKDLEGNILKGVPVRIGKPHRMEVVAHPHPESKQLLVNHEYDINITIFDADDHVIFPSENILTKTTFGKQFDVVDISVNGLWAKVRAVAIGVGKIRASLRSTLTPEDDELELVPHVKGVTDFEVFEEVLISPRRTILPWDSSTRPNYSLTYKVSGGGRVYGYTVSPDHLATVDSEGKVTVQGGPGRLTVTAGMSKSMHNNHTAEVLLLPPAELELPETMAEWMTNSGIQVPVSIYARHPDTKERVMYTDCSDIALNVTLSNPKDFSYRSKSSRGDPQMGGGCVSLEIRGSEPGSTTKVTVTLTTQDGMERSQFKYVSTYNALEAIQPPVTSPNTPPTTVLPIGGSRTLLLKGGPHPWVGKPSFFFSDVEVEEPEIVRAEMVAGVPLPHHAARVTCLKLGSTLVEIGVGNKVSSTNKKPGFQKRGVMVHCSAPHRISKVEVKAGEKGVKEPRASPATGRVLTYNYRDFSLVTTIKDAAGRTLDNVTSLDLRYTLSDPELAMQGEAPSAGLPTGVEGVTIPRRPARVLHPNGRKGDLTIQVAVVGYRGEVLASVGADTPPPLPAPPAAFGEDDDEDYDYDDEGEPVVQEGEGLAEEVELTLCTDAQLEVLYD